MKWSIYWERGFKTMNYDKQKPLTQEEIDYINSKKNIKLICIPHYQNNNIHVEIKWGLPIKITRNEDSIWWNGYTESNKENYWVVYPHGDSAEYCFDLPVTQFKNIDKAIEYALKWYKVWIENRLQYLNSF